MKAFIDPPKNIPFYLRIGIWISKTVTGRDLLPARLLACIPKRPSALELYAPAGPTRCFARLQQQPGAGETGPALPCGELIGDASAQPLEVEGRFVVGIRDARPTTRVEQPQSLAVQRHTSSA